jgi:MFS transporter, DHA1 family, multidrug resistance protein
MSRESAEINFMLAERRGLLMLLLTLMSMAGLVGTDIYLPSLPVIGNYFYRDMHAMQLTLGIYMFALSIGQLIIGPLTDAYGRRRFLIGGMTLYLVSSLFCAISESYSQLVVFRIFQGLGASSGLVIGRAIVGDLYNKKDAGVVFATIFPFVGMSPAISPVIGGFIAHVFGWRATFLFVGIFSLVVLLLGYFILIETVPEEGRKDYSLKRAMSGYPGLLVDREFLFYALAPCFAYVAYFAYIAQSAFILHERGFGVREIGMFYILISFTYVMGNVRSRKLLLNRCLNDVLRMGYLYFNLGALLLTISSWFSSSLVMMIVSVSIMTFGNGFLIPLGTAGAVSSYAKKAGHVSGLLGFMQIGMASLSAVLIGVISQNSIFRMGLFIFAITILSFIMHLYLHPKKA